MILGFSEQFDGVKLNFIRKIADGIKKHTLREDVHDRWNDSRMIQFCTGVRSKKFKEYFRRPCTGVQRIKMVLPKTKNPFLADLNIYIDGGLLSPFLNSQLVQNDGIDDELTFLKYFFYKQTGRGYKQVRTVWEGTIIHWTDLRYNSSKMPLLTDGTIEQRSYETGYDKHQKIAYQYGAKWCRQFYEAELDKRDAEIARLKKRKR